VFVARWVGALRALVPLVAGISEMPFRRFLAWDAAAAVLWVTTMIWPGATLGDDIASVIDRIGTGISLVVVGVLVLVVVLRSRGIRPFRRPAGSAPGGGTRRSRGGD
jgi:membrane-associated protein